MYGTSASWKGCVFCALLLLVPLWAGEMENKETRNSLYASIRRQTLGEITLSSRPSREDVRTYIRRIAEADRGLAQDNYVFDDATHALKHRMLERVGREHLDVLLMNLPDRDVASYCLHRINNVVTEEDKDLIIEWLEDDSRLGIVVAAHRWALDARPVLVRKLVAHPRWVSEHCIYSIAQLRDPSTYDDLRWYFVNGSYPGFTYDAIKDVPGIGLTEEMIQRAWTGDTSGYKCRLVVALLDFGMLEGLHYVVKHLGAPWHRNSFQTTPRELVLRYTEARGNDEQLYRWFDENKDRLHFNADSRTFRVR